MSSLANELEKLSLRIERRSGLARVDARTELGDHAYNHLPAILSALREREAVCRYLRDPAASAKAQEPWFTRTKSGNLTSGTRQNLGVAFIHAQDLAKAIEAGEHMKGKG